MRQMRRQLRAEKQNPLEEIDAESDLEIKSESSEGGLGQPRNWLRKNASLAVSSPQKSPFHALCSSSGVGRAKEAASAAEERLRRVQKTRKSFQARERATFTALSARTFLSHTHKQRRVATPGPVLLDMNHWCLHVDGDYLGYDREAEFALCDDAKYVFMPDAVADGGPVFFRVHAVLGRWRLLLVMQTSDCVIERFKRAALCRHGVARHVCRHSECQSGSSLADTVPALIFSASSGVRACMGVLSPAVKRGVKVQVSKGWCENGSSEPVKYSALLGVQGALDEEVAPGLWTVKWPSSQVNTAQFCDPFPLVGTPGQGLAVCVAIALKNRIDAICGTSAMEQRFIANMVTHLCDYLNVQPSRVSVEHVQKQNMTLRFHRSVTSDTRTPTQLAEALVSLINSGVTAKRVPEVVRSNIVLRAHSKAQHVDSRMSMGSYALANIARLKDAISHGGQMGSLEYGDRGHEQTHLSQVRRADTSAAALARRRGALELFSHSVTSFRAMVELNVVGGLGLHSEVLENFSLRPDLQRKVLLDLVRAALPEVESHQQLQAIAESMRILSVEQHGFELANALKTAKMNHHDKSLRTVRRQGMARLGKAVNIDRQSAAGQPRNVLLGAASKTAPKANTRLIVSLRFSVRQDTLALLPDLGAESGKGRGVGGGRLKEWPVLFAMRIVGAVLDSSGSLYSGRSVITQMVEEGSTLAASLDLLLPDQAKGPEAVSPRESQTAGPADPTYAGEAGVAGSGGGGAGRQRSAVLTDGKPLVKSHQLCVALLKGAAPQIETEDALTLLQQSHNNMLAALDTVWRRQAAGKSAAITPRMSQSPLLSPSPTHQQASPDTRSVSNKEEDSGLEGAEGVSGGEEERVVSEGDVCESCHTGRMRGGKAGCDKCGGRCCFAGVRVRLRECVDPHHHLAVFKDCDGWLEERVHGEPGRWLVRFQGAAEAVPCNIGAGGIYDLCYPQAEARLSRHLTRDPKARTPLRPERTRPLYFGERMNQRQSAAHGVLWPESQEPREEVVLPHTARAGARVIVSRAWCRGPFQASVHGASRGTGVSEARYARFVGRIGTLTRPAVGGSWYVSFEGLPGEYAFPVSGGVTALAFVPAFYSSVVSTLSFSTSTPGPGVSSSNGDASEPMPSGRQRVGAGMRLHVSFAFSRAFGPGDTVSVHLPGFSIGARVDEEEAALAAAMQRVHESAAAREHTRAVAEAARVAAEAATGSGAQAESAEESALQAAQEADEAAAEAKAAFARAWATDARAVSGLNAVKKTPFLVEQSRLQHVRGNKAPHCLTTRHETVTASEIKTLISPANLVAISEQEQGRDFLKEQVFMCLHVFACRPPIHVHAVMLVCIHTRTQERTLLIMYAAHRRQDGLGNRWVRQDRAARGAWVRRWEPVLPCFPTPNGMLHRRHSSFDAVRTCGKDR